jgi:hypothetical protein
MVFCLNGFTFADIRINVRILVLHESHKRPDFQNGNVILFPSIGGRLAIWSQAFSCHKWACDVLLVEPQGNLGEI